MPARLCKYFLNLRVLFMCLLFFIDTKIMECSYTPIYIKSQIIDNLKIFKILPELKFLPINT